MAASTAPRTSTRPGSARPDSARPGSARGPDRAAAPGSTTARRWAARALRRGMLPLAALWSATYVVLAAVWLVGGPGNPADPAVDPSLELSVLALPGPRGGAALLGGLALAGLGACAAMVVQRRRLAAGAVPGPVARRTVVGTAVAAGLVLALALPDFRLLATVAYAPILLVMALAGALPEGSLLPWAVVSQALVTLGGVALLVAAADHRRAVTGACPRCGRRRPAPDATPHGSAGARGDDGPGRLAASAARWAPWAVGVAVAVPVGYAVTRFAWALGIPLGVRQTLLDELGTGVYAGAGLATLAVGGAVLTLGLVQHWGEVFPRWVPRLRGRPVPVGLAVVPASVVSVVVASAGLMFVRIAATGRTEEMFPGAAADVAAWLPEMFWPLWGVALAAATWAYRQRRRTCAEHDA